MDRVEIMARVGAGMVLVGITRSALKHGSSDPEEQPEVLLQQAEEVLAEAFEALGGVIERGT